MIRRFGQADELLLASAGPLHAPSWRPDGSLLTFLQQTPDGLVTQMVILSDPPIVRPMISGEDFFLAPVSWFDRQRFFYTADGGIKTRNFDGRRSARVPFTASIDSQSRQSASADEQHRLPVTTPSDQRQVIRSARLFDGESYGYRYGIDVEIAGGQIVSMEPRRDWPDSIIVDTGDVTLLPGFIDSYASLSDEDAAFLGAELLSYGITTLVSPDRPDLDPQVWESAERPGPRFLRARSALEMPQKTTAGSVVLAILPAAGDLDTLKAWKSLGIPVLAESWTTGLGLGADLLMGADSLPASPRGTRYQDIRAVLGFGPVTLLSGLADATTPGLADLMDSRQAEQLGGRSLAVRRFGLAPELSGRTSAVVLGSKPNGLPPGLALHAEFRALQAAGLSGDQVLKSAGTHAAAALRLNGQIGVIAPGAMADFVLVSGDPLNQSADALNVVAVVRNGRFYSLSSLLERAAAGSNVE
jgi:hypothetical protein